MGRAKSSRRRQADEPAGVAPAAWRWPALLALAVIAAVATTSGHVRVPPRSLALLAGAVVVGLALVSARRFLPAAAVAGALAAGAAAGHVLLAPGMPRVHDIVHLWGIWAYGRCIQEGVLYPLWIPYLGAGIPLFQFYGPLNFLLALPGILLGLSPTGAFKLELYAGHVLSAPSMLVASRVIGAGWRGALVAATAYAFAPWRLANFDYRGALGESNAFLFMPLVAAATLRMARRPSRGIGVTLGLSVGLLLLTHTLSLFTLVVSLAPALLVTEFVAGPAAQSRGRRLARLVVPWALALGITAAWWVPFAREMRFTAVAAATADNPHFHYAQHGISAAELAERRLWDQLRVSLPEPRRDDYGPGRAQMPFYFGVTLALLALLAPWWSGRRAGWALTAGAAFALLMATTLLSGPAGSMALFSPVRFPWRFLSPATVLAALSLAQGVSAWNRARRGWSRRLPWLALIGGLIWDAAPYTGAADRIPPYAGIVHWHLERAERWEHWEASLKPATVTGLPDRGVVRVRDLWLPPTRYDTAIDGFFPGYVDWLTPEIYRRYWRSVDPATLARAGVTHGFDEIRPHPVVQRARDYATLEYPGRAPLAVPELGVLRRPGRITIDVAVDEPGARLLVLEQAFPGWKVRIDGGSPADPEARDGFMLVAVPPGAHRIALDYGIATPARRAGLWISGVSLVLILLAVGPKPRRRGPAQR